MLGLFKKKGPRTVAEITGSFTAELEERKQQQEDLAAIKRGEIAETIRVHELKVASLQEERDISDQEVRRADTAIEAFKEMFGI